MAPIIIHGLGLFLLFYKNYIVYKIFNMTMHPQLNYITVQSFVFTSAIVSEVCLLKRKKKKNNKMNNWCKGLLIFNTFTRAVNSAIF